MVSPMSHEKFIIPPVFDPGQVACKDERVVVVAVAGRSRYNTQHSKASFLNTILDNDIFLASNQDENSNPSTKELCDIEGHYDSENRVIYLHLRSMYDTTSLALLCQKASEQITETGFSSFWQRADHQHARAMLFLFSVSHIVVMVHPGSSFDISYVRFFRNLDNIRQKLQPSVGDVLRGLNVSKDWVLAGRPCSPRALFLFETCTLDIQSSESDAFVLSKSRSQKTPPIKRLQHSIEDQIYHVLRKARIITNISNNSLFAVPANQEFVYVHSKLNETSDPVGYYLSQLRANCIAAKDSEGPRSRGYQTNRRTNQSSTNGQEASSPRPSSSSPSRSEPNNFHDFLRQHVDLAHSKGFDDNVGRNPLPAVFELPTAEQWFHVCKGLYDFFMVDHLDTKARPHFNTLKSLLEIDTRFSESRCAKVLPLAESTYQEGLPQHYTRSYHQNKLLQAKRVFCQHARGPACEKYLQQLEAACIKIWQTGRQLCEEISLTGNHCVNELHRLPDFPEFEDSKHLPVMSHTSQVKTKAACNCGRKQAEREDPFDHKTANYDFYNKLEPNCCGKLDHYEMPVFKPSTSESKAGVMERLMSLTETTLLSPDVAKLIPGRKDSGKLDVVQAMSNLSLALSLGQSAGSSDIYGPGGENSYQGDHRAEGNDGEDTQSDDGSGHESGQEETEEDIEDIPVVEEVAVLPPSPTRQHSTTEYLPGMLHTESPAGLLPKFSSWNLLCLANYNTYSPTQGLDQAGFLHGSNFLLPWDLTVHGDREKWPTIGEMSGKKVKMKKGQKDVGEVTLRVYIGMEYECPRGHRFFCSSPEKIYKVPSAGVVKETAHKLVTSDMPLYFPCHCRSSKGFMAQLMRIFIAVPEGPIEVSLRPHVQPAPPPSPLFHPGSEALRLTQGKMWVLRLPYVYLGEKGPFLMPSDAAQISACRILKGLFIFTQLQQDD